MACAGKDAPSQGSNAHSAPIKRRTMIATQEVIQALQCAQCCFRTGTVIGLALVSVAGVGLLGSFNFRGAEADPVSAIQETGFALLREAFETPIRALGLIQPIEVVDVGTQVSGQLSNVWVKPGDRVQSGQLLAEID